MLPKPNVTYFLSQEQYQWLSEKLPTPKAKTGKRPIPNEGLLSGVVYVLKTGCRWQDIPRSICSHNYTSCWRRFRFWQKRGAFVPIWRELLSKLDSEGQIDLSLG